MDLLREKFLYLMCINNAKSNITVWNSLFTPAACRSPHDFKHTFCFSLFCSFQSKQVSGFCSGTLQGQHNTAQQTLQLIVEGRKEAILENVTINRNQKSTIHHHHLHIGERGVVIVVSLSTQKKCIWPHEKVIPMQSVIQPSRLWIHLRTKPCSEESQLLLIDGKC